jgi:hypothetical protein
MSAMSESVKAAVAAGLHGPVHWWERDVFLERMGALLDRLKADRSLLPCARFGLHDGRVVLWHYLSGGAAAAQQNGEDGGEFDVSFPCPPWYPPGSDTCP